MTDLTKYPLIYCDTCGETKPLDLDEMQADRLNDHDAMYLICGECHSIIATLHAPLPAMSKEYRDGFEAARRANDTAEILMKFTVGEMKAMAENPAAVERRVVFKNAFIRHYRNERDRSEKFIGDVIDILEDRDASDTEQITQILDRLMQHYDRK